MIEQSAFKGDLIDKVVRLLQHEFQPLKIMKGGSAGQNLITDGSDIDLVVALRDFNHRQNSSNCERAFAILQEINPRAALNKYLLRHGFEHPFGISVCVDSQDFDVLFTGSPDDNQYGNPKEYYACWYTKDQAAYVKQKKHQHPFLDTAVISLKELRDQQGLQIKSYFIVLLCIEAFDNNGKAHRSAESGQNMVFSWILASSSKPTFTCPVTGNEVWISAASWEALRRVIADTAQANAITSDSHPRITADPDSWVSLVGIDATAAAVLIAQLGNDLRVVTVSPGDIMTADLQFNRVRIFVDGSNKVSRPPKIG